MKCKAGIDGTGRAVSMVVSRWVGRFSCAAGLAAWSLWLGWRITSSALAPVGVIVLVLEVTAFLVALVLTAALWSAPLRPPSTVTSSALPDVFAELLGLDELGSIERCGDDDSGEVARARRGLHLLDPGLNAPSRPADASRIAATAWALIAVEGIRRMVFVAVLVAVLISGRPPFGMPGWSLLGLLFGSQLLVAVGHWLISGGVVRPGARVRWSMASIGAGLGDGVSRTGLPIRWTATMATMVVLNLAIALRGVSDRWTHGLVEMPHDERVAAMAVSWWLVSVGFVALRVMVQPSLGFYGATRRLEETSTRRLALGSTLVVAVVGFVAGLLPGGLPA